MNRLGLLSIYDENGIIDNSLKWYIQEFARMVDELLIISNGAICEKDRQWLQQRSCHFFERENKGYDAGAYKEALENFCQPFDYDEIILSNDTFFGPFISFHEIFEKMEKEPYDFWGLNRRHIPLYDFITSFFLVFRRKVIPAVVDYFHEVISTDLCRDDVLVLFEQGISNALKKKGFQMGSYSDLVAVDIYREPDYLMKIMKSPVIKKRCFEEEYYVEENCRRALKYIKENSDYDISLIKETAKRRYGIAFTDDYECIAEQDKDYDRLFYYGAPGKELDAYLSAHPEVYLYGMGMTADDFQKQYGHRTRIKGYIVSDAYYNRVQNDKERVTALSSVKDKNLPLIVTLSKENSREVAPTLQKFTNVFYLWRWRQ